MSVEYKLPYVLYRPTEDMGWMYHGEVPTLPGCHAWADTVEETLWILEGMAEVFIDIYKEEGRPLPDAISEAGALVVVV